MPNESFEDIEMRGGGGILKNANRGLLTDIFIKVNKFAVGELRIIKRKNKLFSLNKKRRLVPYN